MPYVLASAALELVYFALLATAYSRADLTFVYPVARGSAPGDRARRVRRARSAWRSAAWQVAGVLAVAAGVLLVRGLAPRDGRRRSRSRSASAPASPATRSSTTTGCEHAAAIPYFELVLVLAGGAVRGGRAARGRGALRRAVTAGPLLAGVGMFGAYVLALAALERAEAAPVAALRETSVVMAAVGAPCGRSRVPAAGRGACVVAAAPRSLWVRRRRQRRLGGGGRRPAVRPRIALGSGLAARARAPARPAQSEPGVHEARCRRSPPRPTARARRSCSRRGGTSRSTRTTGPPCRARSGRAGSAS